MNSSRWILNMLNRPGIDWQFVCMLIGCGGLIGMSYLMRDEPYAPLCWITVGMSLASIYMYHSSKRLHQSVINLFDHIKKLER